MIVAKFSDIQEELVVTQQELSAKINESFSIFVFQVLLPRAFRVFFERRAIM